MSVRLILSLVAAVTLIAWLFDFAQVQLERERLKDELESRAAVLGEILARSIEPSLEQEPNAKLQRIVETFSNRERMTGVAIYDGAGQPLVVTPAIAQLREPPAIALNVIRSGRDSRQFQTAGDKLMHFYAMPLHRQGTLAGAMVVLHDASAITAQAADARRLTFIGLLIHALLIASVTVLFVRWSIAGPIAKTAEWMKRLRIGDVSESVGLPKMGVFKPLAQEVMHLTRSLSAARAAAEEEARLREAAESLWTPERLKEHVRSKLQGQSLFVISNREPYVHVRRGKEIECVVPASGVVTALEPVLRACGGTWIAYGGGDADQKTVNEHDRLRVPPEEPQYVLRRIWLTKEEEDGYYYGFSNEGLWPLCHIAHTRPTFRAEDWAHYQAVNVKFADATLEELDGVHEPCVLIQDYHFALLPRLIKKKRPDARVAIFWHIPWPNPEAFGICPWQKELLDGLLGADLVGFHTQFHCNNFLETVDRALESRLDRESFAVNRLGHTTWVKPFPISVAYPFNHAGPSPDLDGEALKVVLFRELGVKASCLGVGVDRIDYTKGLIERFRGLERFFENYPSYQGKLTFVELGEPSRTRIRQYRDLAGEVEEEALRINRRFQNGDWKPIAFLKGHHTHQEITPFYQAADFCLVTSLHDGMNLVAKEYVAARDDDRGVLILSCFAGASRELQNALLINPYDVEQMAEAIYSALEMDPREVRARMVGLRRSVKEANVYRWAANLLSELAQIGPERAHVATSAKGS
jgi:trehalose 6-phosphate synthase